MQTTTAQPGQLSPEGIESVINQAFGQPVGDVLLPAKVSSDIFVWVESILMSIRDESRKDEPNFSHIEGLARAGVFIASFHADSVAHQFDQMADSLAAVGIDVKGQA
jgi:hypothetical protein